MNVKITVEKVVLEGCGCYSLTSMKNGKGKRYFLNRRGEHSVEDIGWTKIRSVSKVDCTTLAISILVVFLIMLVQQMDMLKPVKYNQYKSNNHFS